MASPVQSLCECKCRKPEGCGKPHTDTGGSLCEWCLIGDCGGEEEEVLQCSCGCKCPQKNPSPYSGYCTWCAAGDCFGWIPEEEDDKEEYESDPLMNAEADAKAAEEDEKEWAALKSAPAGDDYW